MNITLERLTAWRWPQLRRYSIRGAWSWDVFDFICGPYVLSVVREREAL